MNRWRVTCYFAIKRYPREIEAMTAATLSNKLLQLANGAVYDADKKVHSIPR